MRRFRTATSIALLLAAVAAIVSGAQAGAGTVCTPRNLGIREVCIDLPDGPHDNPCDREGNPGGPLGGPGQEQGQDPLCASGPAECIAYGLYVSTDPTIGLPGGASTSLARSHARADAWAWGYNGYGAGYGQSDSDAATQRADVPPTLGEGVIESSCFAQSFAQAYNEFSYSRNYASGTAETHRLSLDLFPAYSIPATLTASVLREEGWSATGGAGANSANIVDVTFDSALTGPIVAAVGPAAANTAIPLGPLGTLYLNEQFVSVSPMGCVVHSGDALRLVLNRPVIGGTVTVIVSWVSTAAC